MTFERPPVAHHRPAPWPSGPLSHLIPAPARAEGPHSEGFVLDSSTVLRAGPGTESTERWLRAALGGALGLPLAPGEGSGISLGIDDSLAPEAYRLTAGERGIEIVGGAAPGVFWGAQTLRQLIGAEAFRRAPLRAAGRYAVPGCLIEDSPRFGWRGMMLDVARHFMPKDGVLRYLDLLAAHKLNVFHFHLTDDQGWRLPVADYPLLTEVGGRRA
ncbi:family 20 glycosylhydrolase, partial [Streptomyces sp. NPDC056937]|uniref:family 20 glycosylhydrolase n=1 Tax=Streptomyces sp. NPDC056937 TaxID=3345969 RepID=UPI003634E4BF